ncbi:MAG: xylose isomerase [Bacteroidetes bacterium]|nr:xylose isomerase [Bacteroidota bacterium]
MSSKNVLTGAKTYFPEVEFVPFEGKDSDNPFAFKYYNPEQLIAGKSMADHFRFAIAYWHSFCGNGADPFGMPTRNMPWLSAGNPLDRAKDKMDAAFEFITKIQAPYFCFHDFDLIEEGDSLVESEKRLQFIGNYAKEKMAASGVKVLWGTANLFSHPRYMNGAATNPDFSVVAYAAAQVKHALDISIQLGAENYVFWGGREGYLSLLNTDMKREIAHLATFLHAAKDYARSQGFKGHFFIEPKPAEPTKHQYDYDAATVIGFLKANGLENDFKLNIEVNHATLALHTFQHELTVAAADNMIGSIDANRGDYQNGWDTDQFPNNLGELTEAMLVILQAGGFQGGGVNFDAKIRRNSTDHADLFLAHIGGMDTFARALIAADKIIRHSPYQSLRKERYASFDAGEGALFENGKLSLTDLHKIAGNAANPVQKSGKQELFENILNQYI